MQENQALSIAVVGFGNFGVFLTEKLLLFFPEVFVFDRSSERKMALPGMHWCSLEEAFQKDVIILSVPYESMETLLRQAGALAKPGSLVIDVCSVKVKPLELLLRFLPERVEILGTHPLFGPESAKEGIEGHRIVVCPVRIPDILLSKIKNFLDQAGLQVIEMKPEVHDREMAMVQGLTHFIARALRECRVRNSPVATTSFEHLYRSAELLRKDSWELFQTIEGGNPFAREARRQFQEALQDLEDKISDLK